MDKKDAESSINIYIYVKLVFSLLIASDFYATSEFMSETKLVSIQKIT
jgi:CRISPR-associated endonuclease/helicase Cas3